MRLYHLNLNVTDVPENLRFLETYFGMTCKENRGDNFAIMMDDDHFLLNLMKDNEVHYPKNFHIGFPQKTKEQVDKINQHLKNDGYDVETPSYQHGGYTFYVRAPGEFLVEVPCFEGPYNL